MRVTLFVVRHANAGVRNNLDPHDSQRPLDDVGIRQAEAIANLLGDCGIEEIHSSPALRCRQTVGPLADRLGIAVTEAPELFEGSASSAAIGFVRAFVGRSAVLCSHGDVIPDVLRSLEIGGTRLEGRGCAKGSVWRLDNSTERIEAGCYLGPLGVTV